jgi:hypothetical protein
MADLCANSDRIACYSINAVEGRGNALVASRLIHAGELIFTENPWSWSERNPDTDAILRCTSFCYNCGRPLSDPSYNCGCGVRYCSDVCQRADMDVNGHSWLCESVKSKAMDDLNRTLFANQGHLAYLLTALKDYAKLAHLLVSSPEVSLQDIIQEFIHKFHHADGCRSIHAIRSGTLEFDEEMFQSLIAPAYVDSLFRSPQDIIKSIFTENSLWTIRPEAEEQFVHSKLFSSDCQFLRTLIGIYMTNNLTIQVVSPSTGNVLRGTGLYYLYSKMNHSCLCNTTNSSASSSASISVYAREDISCGEEITTSYLHVSDPRTVSRRKRNRQLRQYLFRCRCALCGVEEDNSDEDSDEDESDEGDD